MKKEKIIAILLELVPIISALISFISIISKYNSKLISVVITITMMLSFFGFVFFLIGRKLVKEDKIIKILGVLDLISTIYVIILYTLVIFVFGL